MDQQQRLQLPQLVAARYLELEGYCPLQELHRLDQCKQAAVEAMLAGGKLEPGDSPAECLVVTIDPHNMHAIMLCEQ